MEIQTASADESRSPASSRISYAIIAFRHAATIPTPQSRNLAHAFMAHASDGNEIANPSHRHGSG
jgi:hypothetical protein